MCHADAPSEVVREQLVFGCPQLEAHDLWDACRRLGAGLASAAAHEKRPNSRDP